ncbi:MAG: aminopeptidase P family protein [Clostridia bacterium]|nr:aminopeptidase P family protein [Clostridia bacterium]
MIKERIEKIKEKLQSGEAALISDEANRRYLTGFPSSAGFVVITPNTAQFFIDSRYFERAQETVDSCEVVLLKSALPQLAELLIIEQTERLYVETERLDHATVLKYKEELDPVVISDEPVLDRLLCDLRAVKSRNELQYIRAAQEMTDRTFTHILDFIRPGRTDMEVALEMEFFMRKLGSEGVSFDFIVVSGKNSSVPHGVPSEKVMENGDFVTMDFGAVVNGYRSDMTRTVAIGKVSDEQRTVYETVLKAQKAALDFIRAGVTGKEADTVARDIIKNAGYGEYFGHSLGHSVGLEIHENPTCSPRDETELKVGTIMTVEPGIYLPGKFGVRIEDMVYVTESGCENLTKTPKELIVL